MTIKEANHLYTVSYLAFQGNLLLTINQSSLWRPKVDIFSNARNDFLHKLSKAIIDENQVVVVEDINVKGLMQSNLAKSISDSSWSKFLNYLRYKAEWYGRTFIQVDKFFPSSKLCHWCGYKKEDLALHERI